MLARGVWTTGHVRRALITEYRTKATIHRWIASGVRGVRLENINIGGARHTSVEALQRFAESLTAGDGVPVVRTSAQREQAADRAEAELEAAGV